MGVLVSGEIPALYNGVSRQPDIVRLPTQVEECDNGDLSVVTGGFSDRSPLEYVVNATALDPATDQVMHTVDRDVDNRYHVMISTDGEVFAYTSTGSSIPVTYDAPTEAAIRAYLSSGTLPAKQRFAITTIIDVTLIANREVVTAMAPAGSDTITGQVETEADLPGAPSDGDIYLIYGTATSLDDYYVKYVAANTRWEEVANPEIPNSFDPDTMPIKGTYSGGSITLEQVVWNDRLAGGTQTVPEPSFIGSTIRDLVLFKSRLGFAADSNLVYSQANDLYNFWPTSATQVLDSDPVDVAVSSAQVSLVQWMVPNKTSMFIAADGGQFEMSSGSLLTPTTAGVNSTTSYQTPNLCRPVTMGSELYFSSEISGKGIIYEYFFRESTVSNVAEDVTKHVVGYLPGNIVKMDSESNSGTLCVLSSEDPDALYVYRTYYTGDTKAQSAWFRWVFNGDVIDFNFLAGELVVLLNVDNEVLLQRMVLGNTEDDAGFNVRLDSKYSSRGAYDAATNTTTWNLPYNHQDSCIAVLGNEWSTPGRQISLTYVSGIENWDDTLTWDDNDVWDDTGGHRVAAAGDLSAYPVIFGFLYTTTVTLSKQYIRSGDNKSELEGDLRIRRMKWVYKDSGPFEVSVTPKGRTAKTYRNSGANVGLAILGEVNLQDGEFSHRVKTKGDTGTISITKTEYTPFTIVAGQWTGFYHSNVRAG